MEISKKQYVIWLGALFLVFIVLVVSMFLSKSSNDSVNETTAYSSDSTNETTVYSSSTDETTAYSSDSMEERNTYVLSPACIKYFFTDTAEEFFSTNYSWYNSCEDFRKHAEIDENGNLILHLTKEQEEAHLQTYNSAVERFKNTHGVDVAEDYSSFTITGTEEEVSHILTYYFPITLMFEMKYRQLYSGKSPETITIMINLVNKETGETEYSATWPQEPIKFNFDDPFP